MNENMLEVKDLKVAYGSILALKGISFDGYGVWSVAVREDIKGVAKAVVLPMNADIFDDGGGFNFMISGTAAQYHRQQGQNNK